MELESPSYRMMQETNLVQIWFWCCCFSFGLRDRLPFHNTICNEQIHSLSEIRHNGQAITDLVERSTSSACRIAEQEEVLLRAAGEVKLLSPETS